MRRLITICLVIVLFGTGYAKSSDWHILDATWATDTWINGIDGYNLVGGCIAVSGDQRGFVYNKQSETWTPLNFEVSDIDGGYIVGENMIYDMTNGTSTTFTVPLSGATMGNISGIDGDNIVGNYTDSSSNQHGFWYNMQNEIFNTLDFMPTGIDGDIIAGYYEDSAYTPDVGGRLYNITNSYSENFYVETWGVYTLPEDPYGGGFWTWLPCPTIIYGIDGGNVVGSYFETEYDVGNHGFVSSLASNGEQRQIIDYAGAQETTVLGIDGINKVGSYIDAYGTVHGFLIPEPATVLLLGLGGLILRRRRP
jgi:hypothetical protein